MTINKINKYEKNIELLIKKHRLENQTVFSFKMALINQDMENVKKTFQSLDHIQIRGLFKLLNEIRKNNHLYQNHSHLSDQVNDLVLQSLSQLAPNMKSVIEKKLDEIKKMNEQLIRDVSIRFFTKYNIPEGPASRIGDYLQIKDALHLALTCKAVKGSDFQSNVVPKKN